MSASGERRRFVSAVVVDSVFVVAFLISAAIAVALAFPVWVTAGLDGPEAVRQLAPTASDAGDVVAWSRSMLWPDVSSTWADGEVTRYTAPWAFGLPMVVVVGWLAVVVLQVTRGARPGDGGADEAGADTRPLGIVAP